MPQSVGIGDDHLVLRTDRLETTAVVHERRSYALLPDALIAVVLTVTAFSIRVRTMPRDGLWHDDAVTTLGAVEGSARQFLMVGFDHPGFTMVLRSWWWVTGGNSARMADLALVAGTIGPPALYLVLRRFGYARSTSALLGVALVASEIHIIYSGRVRSYVIDVLVVLALAAIVPSIARMRWSWRTAVAWLAGAVLVASLGVFALVALAAAGIILVLHSVGDRQVRVVAVAAQLAVNVVFLTAVQGTYNAEELRTQWKRAWDAFVDLDLNPIQFGGELLRHLTRVATVFPGGPSWWAALCVVAALVGLLAISRTGRHAIRGRFLLLLVLVGLAGGLADRLPFGPSGAGRRVTLWLVPAMAVGLAAVLQLVRRRIADRSTVRRGFDILAFVLAAVIVVTALWRNTPEYPFPGSKSAAEFVDSRLGKNDEVLVYPGGRYSYALEARSRFVLRSQDETIGFVPVSLDARRTFLDDDLTPRQIIEVARIAIDHASRVFILLVPGGGAGRFVYSLELLRRSSDFEVERTLTFDDAHVMIWRRSG